MKRKDAIILTVAAVVPFGLTALGIWKAYELFKGKKEDEKGSKEYKERRDGIHRSLDVMDDALSSKDYQRHGSSKKVQK